jgi:hypothetical protein
VVAVLSTATAVVAGSSGCSASTGKGSARFAKFQAAPKSQGLDVSYVAKITINTRSISEFRAQDADVRAKSPARVVRRARSFRSSSSPRSDHKIEIEAIAVAP